MSLRGGVGRLIGGCGERGGLYCQRHQGWDLLALCPNHRGDLFLLDI